MGVVIFTPPDDCVACRTTKLRFERLGIPYQEVTADAQKVEELKAEGHTGFPVVTVDCGDGATWSWSGYRHDDIKKLAQLFG